jgi:hypothetical protein
MQKTSKQFYHTIGICRELFRKKLQDYGASFRVLRTSSLTDQIFIKVKSLRNFQTTAVSKVGESEEENFIAIVNYSIIGLIQMEKGFADDFREDHTEILNLYDRFANEAKELMLKKNHDYGEAWREMRISSITDLIYQKVLRTKQIEDNSGTTLVSEGIDANYFDMLNYAAYFSPTVFNIPFLQSQALIIAIVVVAFELIFGFFLLMKSNLKFTLTMLIALCVFFAFLTFYSAYFNVVTDCGCFGDALKFTPWQSFWKDIFLLTGLLMIYFFYRNDFIAIEEKTNFKKYFSAFAFLTMVFVINWGITHEPIIDFRDYKIGTDLKLEKQKIAKDPSEFKTFYSIKNEKSGEILELNQDDYVNDKKYWEEGSPWKIDESKTTSKLMKQGYESEIAKFHPEAAGGIDLTEEILKAPKAVLIFAYDPKNANVNILAQAEAKLIQEKNALIYGISTNPNTFKTIKNAMMDGTAIKTIARSNPFVLTLENGKITDKRSAEDYIKKK